MCRILYNVLVSSLVVFILSCDNGSGSSTLLSYVSNPRMSPETRIFDNASLIKNKKSLNSHLKTLYDLYDIDMVVVTVNSLQGNDIDNITNRLLTNWNIGENTYGFKAVLILLSVEEKLVRFKIGSDLEWIYPESFIKYIEQEQIAPYFESGRIQAGVAATLESIIARANEEIEGGLYDTGEERDNLSDYYSIGNREKNPRQIKSIKIPDKADYPDDIKSLFIPQSTPEEAYLLDIEKNKRHIRGYNYDLYTDETREISRDWAFTKTQMDNEVKDTRGKTFKVFTGGKLAIIVFEPQYRNCAPVYLIKNDKGWQIDIATMSRTIHFDMRNQAHIGISKYIPLFRENGYSFGDNGFLYYAGQEPESFGVAF